LSPADVEKFPRPDPSTGFITVFVGKKGSGKSFGARQTFDRYPYDGVCIDPTRDAKPTCDYELLDEPLPGRFPWSMDSGPRKLLYQPDPRSPRLVDDIDAAMALVLNPSDRPCIVWSDEGMAAASSAHSTGRNHRLFLTQSRHYGPASGCFCFARPRRIDPLYLHQADLVFIYRVPSAADRRHLAENMGYPVDRFEREYSQLVRAAPYSFLLWDNNENVLWQCPPLPSPRSSSSSSTSEPAGSPA